MSVVVALGEFIASPVPETFLLVGGLLAIFIAIVGRKKESSLDEVALFLSFFIGILMIALGILLYTEEMAEPSTMLALAILGLALFSRTFKGVRWATLVALTIAVGVGLGLYWISETYAIGFLSTTIILIVAFVIYLIIWFMLKAVESVTSLLGTMISFRPFLLIGGMVAILEGVLLIMGTSISAIIA